MKVKVVDGPRAGMLIEFDPKNQVIRIPDEGYQPPPRLGELSQGVTGDMTLNFSTYVLKKDGDEYSYHLAK